MKSVRTTGMVIVAVVCFATAQVGFAAAFTNGGFESPLAGTAAPGDAAGLGGGFANQADSIDLDTQANYMTGWTFLPSGSGHKVGLYDGNFFGKFGGATAAVDGTQYLAFNFFDNVPLDDAIEQTFDTVIGTKYRIEYSVGRADFNGTTTPAFDVTLTSNGGTLGDLASKTTTNPVDASWLTDSVIFTATTTSTTVRFTDASIGDSVSSDSLLDAVSLTVVPEPASLALLGMGGLLMLRRTAVR